jgi:hypothetical protein
VIASEKVPDDALLVALDIVNSMLAMRPDVRKALIAREWRTGVIAEVEMTMDIPEYARLKRPGAPAGELVTQAVREYHANRSRGLARATRAILWLHRQAIPYVFHAFHTPRNSLGLRPAFAGRHVAAKGDDVVLDVDVDLPLRRVRIGDQLRDHFHVQPAIVDGVTHFVAHLAGIRSVGSHHLFVEEITRNLVRLDIDLVLHRDSRTGTASDLHGSSALHLRVGRSLQLNRVRVRVGGYVQIEAADAFVPLQSSLDHLLQFRVGERWSTLEF